VQTKHKPKFLFSENSFRVTEKDQHKIFSNKYFNIPSNTTCLLLKNSYIFGLKRPSTQYLKNKVNNVIHMDLPYTIIICSLIH